MPVIVIMILIICFRRIKKIRFLFLTILIMLSLLSLVSRNKSGVRRMTRRLPPIAVVGKNARQNTGLRRGGTEPRDVSRLINC